MLKLAVMTSKTSVIVFHEMMIAAIFELIPCICTVFCGKLIYTVNWPAKSQWVRCQFGFESVFDPWLSFLKLIFGQISNFLPW